ncbi:MAG: FkbM family methyltransferase [Candidatus Acidiferrales bacterium]|jgi:FkbM family methyltransferase
MDSLYGPRMYYSLFGPRGLLVGARARLSSAPIVMSVAVPGVLYPVYLRARTTDVSLCREIFLNNAYDSDFFESPQGTPQVAPAGMPPVIIDAGANVGLCAVFYANRFPDARIIAIEPEPSNYEMLKKNTAPYPNITTVHAALWKENGRLRLFDTGAGNTAFQVSETSQLSATEERGVVQAIALEKLMEQFGIAYIDYLKMDVEGAEKEIFEHAPWIDRVGAIGVELHDWMRSGCSEIVRQAAKDFPHQWQRGEITYFARKERAAKSSRADETPGAKPLAAGPRFPLKILDVN